MSNPYLIDRPALIAFSGGRTSGFMLRQIIDAFGGSLPDDVIPTFCNTGLEHPATLDFVKECGERWGVNVRWLEYRAGQGGTRAQQIHELVEVDHATASRNGEPFEQLIDMRTILPNPVSRFCTQDLKARLMDRYVNTFHQWESHTVAIGLRYDEPHRALRLRSDRKSIEKVCPMYDARHTLADVNAFWDEQPFRLGIPMHQGNCQGCFLKSAHRLEMVARETPEALERWVRHEAKAAAWGRSAGVLEINTRFRHDRPGYRVQLEMAKEPTLFCGLPTDDDTMPCDCTD